MFVRLGVLLGACLLALPGCGSTDLPLYPVTGKVTLSGAPIADATISLVGDANPRLATGRTDSSGRFTMTTFREADGVAAGKYVVTVSKFLVETPTQGAQPTSMDQAATTPVRATIKAELPPQFADPQRSPLQCEVSPEGPNDFTFELGAGK